MRFHDLEVRAKAIEMTEFRIRNVGRRPITGGSFFANEDLGD